MSNGKRIPSLQDAMAYLMKVKLTFLDETEKYTSFLHVLKDYRAQRIGIACFTERVKKLFKGHKDLIEGFNFFLLEEYEITIPLEDEELPQIDPATVHDAIAYVERVRDTFPDEREKFQHFVNIMKDFRAERIDLLTVTERVKELFKEHRDLLVGFNVFLPKEYEITLPLEDEQPPHQLVELAEDITFMGKIKTWIEGENGVYRSFLDGLDTYRREAAEGLQGYADLLYEFTNFFIGSTEEEHEADLYRGLN